jgi:AcrR family transcriptional regulator
VEPIGRPERTVSSTFEIARPPFWTSDLDALDKMGHLCQSRHMTSITAEERQGESPSRQDEIVEAAIPVFLRFGYKKASMDAVAAAADLSRQAVYLHFSNKEALFSAVVIRLSQLTRDVAHVALWRSGLSLNRQLLAAFDEMMPDESMELLSELLVTAKDLVPQSVVDIDALVVHEISERLQDALAGRQWPVSGVTIEEAAEVLQAASYGLKQQTDSRTEYLQGMQSAIDLILTAGGLMPSTSRQRSRSGRNKSKGV